MSYSYQTLFNISQHPSTSFPGCLLFLTLFPGEGTGRGDTLGTRLNIFISFNRKHKRVKLAIFNSVEWCRIEMLDPFGLGLGLITHYQVCTNKIGKFFLGRAPRKNKTEKSKKNCQTLNKETCPGKPTQSCAIDCVEHSISLLTECGICCSSFGVNKVCRSDRGGRYCRWNLPPVRHVNQHSET